MLSVAQATWRPMIGRDQKKGITLPPTWRDWGEPRKNLSYDSRSPSRYLNPGPPAYEAGVLTTQPRHSVEEEEEEQCFEAEKRASALIMWC
jgi:hypothetical protein